jgi:hypothetical protein
LFNMSAPTASLTGLTGGKALGKKVACTRPTSPDAAADTAEPALSFDTTLLALAVVTGWAFTDAACCGQGATEMELMCNILNSSPELL